MPFRWGSKLGLGDEQWLLSRPLPLPCHKSVRDGLVRLLANLCDKAVVRQISNPLLPYAKVI
ncbi:MAG: hypothetical protein RIR18_2051 [Pseudomonadota bacterium]|jgi:hypothetical protein